MFHVEVRQFPHVARAFNLSREQLEQRILAPWCAGNALVLDDQRFTPGRARVAVYEGPALDSSEIGLGRGWANAARAGRDVTAQVFEDVRRQASSAAESAPAWLKRELRARCASAPIALRDVVTLAGEVRPEALVSERLALAERAVWELLHERRVRLTSAGDDCAPADAQAWRATLTSWDAWATRGVVIEATAASSRPW